MVEKLKIRDFIYQDVERMKSIFAQIYEGITESSTEEKSVRKLFLEKEAYLVFPFHSIKRRDRRTNSWENRETETKTLHDSF